MVMVVVLVAGDRMEKSWEEIKEEHNIRHLCKMSLIVQNLKYNVNGEYPVIEILPIAKGQVPMHV